MSSENADVDAGLSHDAGGPHYRAYVGPPDQYDLIGALQFSLLAAAGLRETHRLADLGCGSLRAGRLLIPYLRPDHYFGVEPNPWLVDAGIEREVGQDQIRLKRPRFSTVADFSLVDFGVEFDYVIAQSVFSHTYADMTASGFDGVAAALAPTGVLLATYVPGQQYRGGQGWEYPGVVAYPWEEFERLAASAGLAAYPLDWPHPRQRWFVASASAAAERAATLARTIRPPVQPEHGPDQHSWALRPPEPTMRSVRLRKLAHPTQVAAAVSRRWQSRGGQGVSPDRRPE